METQPGVSALAVAHQNALPTSVATRIVDTSLARLFLRPVIVVVPPRRALRNGLERPSRKRALEVAPGMSNESGRRERKGPTFVLRPKGDGNQERVRMRRCNTASAAVQRSGKWCWRSRDARPSRGIR